MSEIKGSYSRLGMVGALLASAMMLGSCLGAGASGGALGLAVGEIIGDGGGGGDDFVTSEFNANYGLGAINAAAAYAAGATGQGVTVAVIDSGVDLDHPDLAANISAASVNIVTDVAGDAGDISRFPVTADDKEGHGTNVSGVIAALKNSVGTHGVAYESTILGIRADAQLPECGDDCGFFDTDIAEAIDYAVANGAQIINLSLGGPGANSPVLDQALIDAVTAGVIIVAASGNSGAAIPDNPARFAGTPDAAGLVLAVGAVDADLADSGFHNRAGDTLDFFLVAPGVSIVTTALGGGTATVSGTSFSAPHVAGALALLLDLFPSSTPEDIVQILLDTATDLGDAGPDQVFGQGLVNLADAVSPVGTLSVPLSLDVAGPGTDLTHTTMNLGLAFGDALDGNAFLGQAVAVDSYLRPYQVDLTRNISRASADFGLDAFVDSHFIQQVKLPAPDGSYLVLDYSEAMSRRTSFAPVIDNLGSEPRFERLSLSGWLSQRNWVRLGFNDWASGQLSFDPTANDTRTLFWRSESMMGPQYRLVGRGGGASLTNYLGDATTVSFGWFEGESHDDEDDGIGQGSLAQLYLNHRFDSGASLGIGVGLLDERESFLNSQGNGAFDLSGGSTSQFYTVSGTLPVLGLDWLELWGSFTAATTQMPGGENSLFSDWGTVHSNAFGLGLVAKDLFADGDRLGLLVGQPLRVHSAEATLTLPTEVDAEGNIRQRSERLQVRPEGREIDLQLAYTRSLFGGMTVSSWVMMQHEPGHVAEADPAFGGGIKVRFKF